jgi:putative Ca2+/H+ antiporter (TMEM165/GDT1 family)
MDIKIFLTTFGFIFLAEIGDKTQLATLAFAAGSESRFSVFLGAAIALTITSAIAVLLGEGLSRLLPLKVLHIAAATGFVVIGVFMLAKELYK